MNKKMTASLNYCTIFTIIVWFEGVLMALFDFRLIRMKLTEKYSREKFWTFWITIIESAFWTPSLKIRRFLFLNVNVKKKKKKKISTIFCCLKKKRLWHKCFPVNFAKFLKKLVLQNTSGRLLLDTRK